MNTTSTLFKRGDVREDGFIFVKYRKRGDRTSPVFTSPKAFHRQNLAHCVVNARVRAAEAKVPFEITADYLEQIFPDDSLCPVFQTPMSWGTMAERANAPTIDRIIPAKGYVEGNIVFVSYRANRIKNDSNIHELKMLVEFYSKLTEDNNE